MPRDNPLIVEAHVPLDAISELRQGLPAQVRLTAYRQRTTPLIEGRVTYVSADALSDKQATAPHFVVYVELSKASLEAAGALNLHPGMAAEVYIKTSERTALDYLLEPILVSIRRAFRDH